MKFIYDSNQLSNLIRMTSKAGVYHINGPRYGSLNDKLNKFWQIRIFCVKFSKMRLLAISIRLNEISRLVPKLFGLDDFEQSYDQLNFDMKNTFLPVFMFGLVFH